MSGLIFGCVLELPLFREAQGPNQFNTKGAQDLGR